MGNNFSHSIQLSNKEICQTDLLTIPPFVRFNSVTLYYDSFEWTSMKLKDGCEWTQMILQPFKPALKGAKFDFTDTGYNSMLQLHTHLEQELLLICDDCRSYRFSMNSSNQSAKELISKFLQFDQINCCSNVLFHVCILSEFMFELPVEVDVVVNWLNRSRINTIDADEQMENYRILVIEIDALLIGNVSEMLNCLKKVNLNHLSLIT